MVNKKSIKVIDGESNTTIPFSQPIQPYHKLAAKLACRYLASREPVLVMDIGCGTGNSLIEIEKQLPSCDFNIADIDPRCIEICSSRLEISNAFLIDGIDELNKIETKYDLVLYSHVLQYEYRPLDAMRTLMGLVNSEGIAIVMISNVMSPVKIINNFFRKQYSQGVLTWDRSTFFNLINHLEGAQLITWEYDYIKLPLISKYSLGVKIGQLCANVLPYFCFSLCVVLKKT